MEPIKPIMLYTPVLKRTARVTALQDPARITAGRRYRNPYRELPVRSLSDPIIDGCPYAGHGGIDFSVGEGTPVYSPWDGKIWTTWAGGGGNRLKVIARSGLEIGFSHLKSYVVKSGAHVKKGDLVAYSGNSGTNTTGAHLHADVYDNSHCLDAFPYVMGIWDEFGRPTGAEPLGSGQPAVQESWDVTDPFEYMLPRSVQYVVDTGGPKLTVRMSPGRDKQARPGLEDGSLVTIDKRCDLPNGERWGRLAGKPWHWVCLYDGKEWLVKDAPPPARRYALTPPKVYLTLESIQGYTEPNWSGAYAPVIHKDNSVVITERYDDALGRYFGMTDTGTWILLRDPANGWNVIGGWSIDDSYTAILDEGTDTINGTYYECMKCLEKVPGIVQAPGGVQIASRKR